MANQQDLEVVAPHYSSRTVEITIAVAGTAGTFLGLLWQQPAIQLRVVAGASLLLGALVLTHVPFAVRWLICQITKVRRYTLVLKMKSEAEDRLSKIQAKYALAAGAVPLSMLGFFSEGETTIVVFARDDALTVQVGERIYIVDDLQRKHRATGTVRSVGRELVEAVLGDADALFKGYLRLRTEDNPGMTCEVPESLVGLRENDIEARYEAFRDAVEESQYA